MSRVQPKMAFQVPALGLDRGHLIDLRNRFGADAFGDYFGSLSAEDLRDILLGVDPHTLMLPELGHDDLLARLAWFAEPHPEAIYTQLIGAIA